MGSLDDDGGEGQDDAFFEAVDSQEEEEGAEGGEDEEEFFEDADEVELLGEFMLEGEVRQNRSSGRGEGTGRYWGGGGSHLLLAVDILLLATHCFRDGRELNVLYASPHYRCLFFVL